MSFMPLRQIADSFDVVKQEVDSRVVTETKCLEGIRATGLPWQIRHKQTGIVLLLVPPGKFIMGMSQGDPVAEKSELPAHEVTISRPFYLGETVVTQREWSSIIDQNPSSFPKKRVSAEKILISKGLTIAEADERLTPVDRDQLPVECVSWDAAKEFLQRANLQLPSEAQWEYACRAGNRAIRYGPLQEIAWYQSNSNKSTQLVRKKKPNQMGFYDMLGNVFEWCEDYFSEFYYRENGTNSTDPTGPTRGNDLKERVLRGGSWDYSEADCRASARLHFSREFRMPSFGFRVMKKLR